MTRQFPGDRVGVNDVRVARHRKTLPIVMGENRPDKERHRVLAEIGREVGDADALVRRARPRSQYARRRARGQRLAGAHVLIEDLLRAIAVVIVEAEQDVVLRIRESRIDLQRLPERRQRFIQFSLVLKR